MSSQCKYTYPSNHCTDYCGELFYCEQIFNLEAQLAEAQAEIKRLRVMLEDVVNELDWSDSAIAEHGPLGSEMADSRTDQAVPVPEAPADFQAIRSRRRVRDEGVSREVREGGEEMKARKDRRICRTCVSYVYVLDRYGYCKLIGRRVQGWIGGNPCWKRRVKNAKKEIQK